MVTVWIVLAVYLVGLVITARVYFHFDDDAYGRGESRFHSFLLGLVWPLGLAIFVVVGLIMLPTLGAKNQRDRQVEADTARCEQQQAAARVAELEREAGLGEQ